MGLGGILSTTKKFFIVGKAHDGIVIDESGNEFRPFTAFILHMKKRGYATNTINSYGEHVVRFLNYINDALELNVNVDRARLTAIIDSYPLYLLHGIDTEDEIARPIAQKHNNTHKTSLDSLSVIDSAISYFIKLGELEQQSDEDNVITPLFDLAYRDITRFERDEIRQNSMIGGVLASRLSAKQRVRFGVLGHYRRRGESSSVTTRSIDLEKIVSLIESASNLRNKVFYSLLAATGGRTHEVLQVTRRDINVQDRTVKFVDPFEHKDRLDCLTLKERESLAWKGRATELTFMIEPFKSMFFKYFEAYRREDWISTVNHDYIFQSYPKGKLDLRAGRPYFASDRSSRIKQFKKAAKKAGIEELLGISPHSLRHAYGIYTLNYLPLPNNTFGLSLPHVRVLMGHTSIASTEKYAKQKEDLAVAIINYANELLFNNNVTDLKEVRVRYLQNEIAKLEQELLRIEEAV